MIMCRFRVLLPVLSLAVLSAAVCGCGKRNDAGRLPVSGEVTFEGKPLDKGQIRFVPTGEKGISSGAMIVDGAYQIPADKGLPPGTYKIQITSAGEEQAAVEELPGESGPPAKERIPAKYNVKSDITREVKSGEENRFDFEIK
jgi:hypothetical protein